MKRAKKVVVFLFLICFGCFSFAYSQPSSIILLYVEDITGRGPDDLTVKFTKIFEESVLAGDYRLVKTKDFEDMVRKQGFVKALEYIDILDDENIIQLGKIIGIDKLVYISITGYDEVSTKERSIVFIQINATFISSREEISSIFSAASKIEIAGKKTLDKTKNRALSEVILSVLSQSLNKDYNVSAGILDEIIGNKKSKLFHTGGVRHLPDAENTVRFKTIDEAKKENFTPCAICFPHLVPSTENATSLELGLSSQISGFIEHYYRVLPDEKIKSYVDKVGREIIKATPRQNLRYIFTVLDSDEINAFAVGAGGVYITKGLLDIIENEDELAGVLAHEVAHNVKRHIIKQYRRNTNLSILGAILSGGDTNIGVEFAKSLFMSGYDRKYEREADKFALIYSIRANFDPQGYVLLLKKLLDLEKAQPSKLEFYFRSHPPTPERIKRAEEFLADYNNLVNKLGGK